MAKYTAIVLSAGKGSRMGSSVHKQYLLLCGRPVIYYTLKAFEESPVDEIVLVTGEGEEEYCRKEIVEKYKLHKVTKIVKGGKERYHSVFQGLSACEHTDYVLIHDGARPFIGQEVIRHTMDEVQKKHACIAAVPVKDTIKKVDENGKVEDTPPRKSLYTVQTPQAFSYSLIYDSYQKMIADGREDVTDDAMVVEAYGKVPVYVIDGSYDIPMFEYSKGSGRGFQDYLQIILAVLIFALLGYVVFRSTRKEKETEIEPELSVESLLETTKQAEQEDLEDIGYNEKSEIRVLIEKFVDENPEAVASLLRNWLNEEWE